jgi:hypothetical protein
LEELHVNEREPIEFEMNELKEQGRLDFDLYFDLRKHRNERYSQLQDRLRTIDERDMKVNTPIVNHIQVKRPDAREAQTVIVPLHLRERTKDLPDAKSAHMTQGEMRVDRIKVEEKPVKSTRVDKKSLAPIEETTEAIEVYLKNRYPKWVPTRDVKKVIEKQFQVEWKNFSNVMERAIQFSPYIEVNKTQKRKHVYRYKEV